MYEKKGLTLLCDLGRDLGGTACSARCRWRRSRSGAIPRRTSRRSWIDALRASVDMHSRIPGPAATTRSRWPRRWTREVTARHIQLYVNDYTRALDERAVGTMLDWGEQQGVFPRADRPVAAFAPAAAGA